MADITAEDIIKKVKDHEDATVDLRNRMEDDYSDWRLDEFDAGEGYHSFTSNHPYVFANKIISWMVGAQLTVQVPLGNMHRPDRERASMKESFIIGMFNSANERLRQQLLPSLEDQLSWFLSLRGFAFGRALLVKDEDGLTYIDITPWDPLHTYWSIGTKGLIWACYKYKKTPDELKDEYGWEPSLADEAEENYDVYDYYDREKNYVVVNDELIEGPKLHHAKEVPVFLSVVGSTPPIQSRNGDTTTVIDFGESVLKPNRVMTGKLNTLMSIMLELAARSLKPPIAVQSRDGSKTLDEDPYKEGTEISLADGESVGALELLRSAQDLAPFLGLLSGEMQRGSIPHSAYGEMSIALSGYAINTLGQSIDTPLDPRLQAMTRAYESIANIILDQYQEGGYAPIRLSGLNNEKIWFDEEITPDMIADLPHPQIKLMGDLPKDDASRYAMAQMAREGERPLLPDLYIRDEVLHIQDADKLDDAVKAQMAESASPMAAMLTLFEASARQGLQDQAMIYLQDMIRLATEQSMSMMGGGMGGPPMPGLHPGGPPGGMPGGGPPGGMPGGGPPGGMPPGMGGPIVPPEMDPSALLGMPRPAPSPQAGPLVPPGTPRPGAQGSDLARQLGIP
jgi:hypothetical protein